MSIADIKRLSLACLNRICAVGRIGITLFLGVGIVLLWGFNHVLDATQTQAFCISCHEMRVNPYEEYRLTTHASVPSDKQVACPDCHVPKSVGPKIATTILASKKVYHSLQGTIDTPEKFDERRLRMAETVWEGMKKTDSRECRECHDELGFDYSTQSSMAAKMHEEGANAGQTCIDCHKGIAHRLPPMDQPVGTEGDTAADVFPPVPTNVESDEGG